MSRGRPQKFDYHEMRRFYEEGTVGERSHGARMRAVCIQFGCSLPTAERALVMTEPGAVAPARVDRYDPDLLRATYQSMNGNVSHHARVTAIMQSVGCSKPTVLRALKDRKTSVSPGGPSKLGGTRSSSVLPVGHPATMERRTLFPSTVKDVADDWVLKSGEHSAKIGRMVEKGPWASFPVYTLTLEERATCPVECRHWSSCYGNNMQWPTRWRHGADLEWRLEREVPALELKHPKGFVVRLHNLGDFYSVHYVRLWRQLLVRHRALHVFGYTARGDCEIGDEIAYTVEHFWPRFAVRFSNAFFDECATISIESPVQKPAGAVICPAQWTPSGKKSESCSTCALCWGTTRRIAFLQH